MAQHYPGLLAPFAEDLREDRIPHVPCPHCKVSVAKPALPIWDEDPKSVEAHDHPGWEATWVSGNCHIAFTCGACGGVVRALGTYDVAEDDVRGSWEDPNRFIRVVTVRVFNPPLPLVVLPAATPKDVADLMGAASSVWPVAPGAVANILRQAVEALLTHQSVETSKEGRNGARRLSLHERLTQFAETDPRAAEALWAVKWVGNEGSHTAALSAREVLDVALILGRALALIYDLDVLSETIAKVNAAKGMVALRRGERSAPSP